MSLPTSWTSRAETKIRSLALREGANVKLVRILLPINQYGTTEACAAGPSALPSRAGRAAALFERA